MNPQQFPHDLITKLVTFRLNILEEEALMIKDEYCCPLCRGDDVILRLLMVKFCL